MYKEEFLKFYNYIELYDDYNYLIAFLRFLTSPTTSGLKVGTMINICNSKRNLKDVWTRNSANLSKIINLSFIELKIFKNSILVYFFNENLLKNHLKNTEIKEYLINLNYGGKGNLDEYFNILKNNFKILNSCPNEIGVFLGYPLKDVKDFSYKDKKCKLSGYWKCYNDVYTSKIAFKKYDNEKLKIIKNYYEDAM
ncbi:DUF3793 family protein [Anaerosphaera multitolerans]|uniref:DUF3793 family protein n=1 Tax=Anaerosphaera multitolerans TaxID=2487351 RepID=A0A437S8C3_9FIRM|nr:DUF3793 family protein [Anaerosphaera multitolerans]RVU55181.1 DUF3793 family protein [Anaerosphaera multitolerans]